MSDRVWFTLVIDADVRIRDRNPERDYSPMVTRTWIYLKKGGQVVATFEEPGFERSAQQFCAFLNTLPENDADAIVLAVSNAAQTDLLKRRTGNPFNDGWPERGVSRL